MPAYPDFSKTAVMVIGDVMLDRYYWGDVDRISPEAPVPVVHVRKKTGTLGGAGNVALNLTGLGCRCRLIGVCGDDEEGDHLVSAINEMQINNGIVRVHQRPTTVKTRIIGLGQQLLRMDEEETGPLADGIYDKLIAAFRDAVEEADAVILSDYGKGVFAGDLAPRIIDACRENGKPVFVDPKGNDWKRYAGATCITPNTAEFKIVAPDLNDDETSLSLEAARVMEKYRLPHLLVTRGAGGMSLFTSGRPAFHIRSDAKEVFDVSGAGDTVIAVLALAVGCGVDIGNAAELANLAAGIVVGKLGTHPIRKNELEQSFYGSRIRGMNKILTLGEAAEIVNRWRSEQQGIVFTNGCFDILHIGHIRLLHAAAGEGDKLIVGLNSDTSVKKLKGPLRPVMGEDERSAILASLKCVDMVILFSEETPMNLIERLQPDVIVKGGDYTPETVVGHEVVEKKGGRVVIFPLIEGISTTRVIDQVKKSRDV